MNSDSMTREVVYQFLPQESFFTHYEDICRRKSELKFHLVDK